LLDPAKRPETESPAEKLVGDELDALLEGLARTGVRIGPRDRVLAAVLVAELVARGHVKTFADLRPWLAPLLVHSAADRDRFRQVFDLHSPVIGPKPPPGGGSSASIWRWLGPTIMALAVFAVTIGVIIDRNSSKPTTTDPGPGPSSSVAATKPTVVATAPPRSSVDALDRIARAAKPYDDAPTLDELASELAKDSTIGWAATSYAVRLSELSGLPRSWPLALYGKDAKDGRVWSMIALALNRIEQPGREPTFNDLLHAADKSLANDTDSQFRLAYDLAAHLPGLFASKEVPSSNAELLADIQQNYRKPDNAETPDYDTIQRALAIVDSPKVRRVDSNAPWVPHYASSAAPWWAAWLAGLIPLALAVFWFANSLAIRKAYLRRRPPELRPLHLDIVSQAASSVPFAAVIFQRIAQKLRLRTSRPTDRLDLASSIVKTIHSGGEFLAPVYEVARRAPEYLVLIERRAAGDQDSRRLRDIVGRLESMVPIDIFYYRAEPSRVEPERGGRSISIEQLQAQFPEHRLLVLGSGSELLDPADQKPHPAAAKLTLWRQRALLTPLPLAEWGREEFALAYALEMPIGRATVDGFLVLAELLGLEGAQSDSLLDPRGDDLARPLPDVFRLRAQRFLYSAPPSDVTIDQIVRDLRNFLDGPGFEWLCALAVYPALQWDLTLYLGVKLPEHQGGDAGKAPLFSEERIAALTQLPWLREGVMPDWLRRALIERLTPRRSAEVRLALHSVISQATLSGDPARDDQIRMRIAQEPAKDRLAPDELLEDEVLLDFLARGRITDFALPGASWLERVLPRRLLDRIGWPELTAAAVAGLYAVAAWSLTPKTAEGALTTGAWMPVVALTLGAILVVAVSNLPMTYYTARRALLWLAPLSLAVVVMILAVACVQPLALLPLVSARFNLASTIPEAILSLLLALLGVVSTFIAQWLAQSLGLPRQSRGSAVGRVASFLVRVFIVLMVALSIGELVADQPFVAGVSRLIDPFHGLASIQFAHDELIGYGTAIAIGLALFGGALVCAHFLPERLPPPKPLPAGSKSGWTRGALSATAAILPILPAVLLSMYVAHATRELQPIQGGVTAVADLPEKQLIALGGADGKVRIYDLGRNENTPAPEIDVKPPVAISELALRSDHDGGTSSSAALAVSTADGSVHLFDAKTGGLRQLPPMLMNLRGEGSKVHLAFAVDGAPIVALETANGAIWLVSDNGWMAIPDGGPVTALAVAPGTEFVAFATLDGRVRFARAARTHAPELMARPDDDVRLPGQVRKLSFVGDNFLALGDDGTVARIPLPDAPSRSMSLQPSDNRLKLGTPVPWQQRLPPTVEAHDGPILGVAFSPDGARVATSSADQTAIVWDVTTGKASQTLRGHVKAVQSVAFSPDGARVITASEDNTARIWDAATGGEIGVPLRHAAGVNSAAFSPDGSRIVTASDDAARIWEGATAKEIVALRGHTSLVNSAKFSPDGSRIVTASADKTARIWDARTGRPLLSFVGHQDAIISACFTPDGSLIVTASADKTARIWDARTGAVILELRGHTDAVSGVASSPDGSRIVTASADNTARVWDVRTGNEIVVLRGHTDEVTEVAFSPDGKSVVTGSIDLTARLWDSATGQTLLVLPKSSSPDIPTSQRSAPLPTLYVLAIGISNFMQKGIYNPRFASKDATDFAQQLADDKLYAKVAVRTLLDKSATRDAVLEALDSIKIAANANDVTMILLSGQGVLLPDQSYRFLPYDFDALRIERTAISGVELLDNVKKIPGRAVLFFDTAHSGAVLGGNTPNAQADKLVTGAGSNTVVFRSSTGIETQLETDGNSVFIKAVLEGLRGAAGRPDAPVITMSDLAGYVSRRVLELTNGKQHPTMEMNIDFAISARVQGQGASPPRIDTLPSPVPPPPPGPKAEIARQSPGDVVEDQVYQRSVACAASLTCEAARCLIEYRRDYPNGRYRAQIDEIAKQKGGACPSTRPRASATSSEAQLPPFTPLPLDAETGVNCSVRDPEPYVQMVCSDGDVARANNELQKAYEAARKSTGDLPGLLEQERAWIQGRDRQCRIPPNGTLEINDIRRLKNCAIDQARTRIAELQSGAPPKPPADNATLSAFNVFANADMTGGDLRDFRNSTYSDCIGSCQSNPSCAGFVFDKWNNVCYLKRSINTLSLDPRSDSVVRSSLPKPALSIAPTNFCAYFADAMLGELLTTSTSKSVDSCKAQCEADSACVAYTFKKPESSCEMFRSVSDRVRSQPDASSGILTQNSCSEGK
jgi:WD40 repeat protein/uncharacterized protein YecT (DUF1311 family)